MSSTFSPNLAIQLIATGDQAGQWGNTTDTNLGTLIESAVSGYVTQQFADANITLPMPLGADGGTGTPTSPVAARNMVIKCIGTLTNIRTLTLPANKKIYFIINNTTGGFALTIAGPGSTAVLPNGCGGLFVCDGTNITQPINYFPVLTPTIVTNIQGSGTTFTVDSTNSPSNYNSKFIGTTTTGLSYGPLIMAGTNSSDVAFYVTSAASAALLLIRGDGSVTVGNPVGGSLGLGSLNAQNLYINGQAAATSASLAAYAPLVSPTFSGTPNTPTAAIATNNSQIASTAFVHSYAAPLASPALTGSPTAPTQTSTDNSTKIATTAFVQAVASGASSIGPVGYDTAPSGKITQWGSVSTSSSAVAVGFGIHFPTALYSVVVTPINYGTYNLASITTAGFTINSIGALPNTFYWQAIGS